MLIQKERKAAHLLRAFTVCLILAAVSGHYLFGQWSFYRKTPEQEASLRMQVVACAQQYLGFNEQDGSHQRIVDLYNAHEPLAMDYTVQYTDSWCATFVSTIAIQCALTDIIPTECGCERQIGLFQEIGQWEESDRYIPLPGDIIYYDWDETKHGDCTGWSDHVGIVVGTKWPFLKVIEGNRDDCVMYRYLLLNDIQIRGYGLPDYTGKTSKKPAPLLSAEPVLFIPYWHCTEEAAGPHRP